MLVAAQLCSRADRRIRSLAAAHRDVGQTCDERRIVMGLTRKELEDRTMRRRELIAIAGTGLVAWPLIARAQQQARIARLGYLGFGSPANAATVIRVEALRAGLRDLGYVEGKNLV